MARVAIIGAGISGLTAAWKLQSRHEVAIFEAADYVGGHTHTHDIQHEGRQLAIDSGFIVFNQETYPHFVALLDELGVRSQPTDMSFSVRWDQAGLEYAGTGLNGLFAQRGNLLRPQFWQLLRDWRRFNRHAAAIIDQLDPELTVGEFFRRYAYSDWFRLGYFLPLGSAVWSSPREAFEQFPLRFVLEFYRNHGMLALPGRVKWRTIQGGSQTYVRALLRRFHGEVRTRSPVVNVHRTAEHALVQVRGCDAESFDHVVFACHSDQALALLGREATQAEREILSAFPYQRNSAVLHTDTAVLPKSRRAWASWNYRLAGDGNEPATITYDMTRLQRLGTTQRFLVTLNSDEAIRPESVLARMVYHHPVFTAARDSAQSRHDELIGPERTSFCGAYWGNGFHEDGVNSALAVCRRLNALPSLSGLNCRSAASVVG